MKSKLIACILGLSIILSNGTPVLAEAENASAGSAVQTAEVPPPQTEPAAPAAPAEPAAPEAPAPAEPAAPAADPGNTGGSSTVQDPAVAEVPQGGESTPSSGESGSGSSAEAPAAEPTPGQAVAGESAEPAESASVSGAANASSIPETKDAVSANSSGSASTAVSSASEAESKAEQEEKSEEEKEQEEEKKEILVAGFSAIAEITVKKKPVLKDALTMLPTVVEAVLSDGNKIYVPVDWNCASDYNNEKADRFTFASSLKKNPDGTVYDIGHPIAPGVKFPTVDLVIKKEEAKKEEDKDARKESKDPVEEDKPLVMDDVTAANLSPDEGEEQVFLYLMNELGINRAAACGVLANIHYESGFNSHAIGDGGTSYGICQWHAGRYLSLVSYCDKIKMPYGSVEGQLKYMEQELENSYPHVLAYLKTVPETDIGAYDAAYYWCYHFERPAMILRQSTLRGNAAKNSYWPRYKDADLEILEKKSKADTVLDKNLVVVTERLEDVDEMADSVLDKVNSTVAEITDAASGQKASAAAETKKTETKADNKAETKASESDTKESKAETKESEAEIKDTETEEKASVTESGYPVREALQAVPVQTVKEYRESLAAGRADEETKAALLDTLQNSIDSEQLQQTEKSIQLFVY